MSKSADFVKKYLGDNSATLKTDANRQSEKTTSSSAAQNFVNKYNSTSNQNYPDTSIVQTKRVNDWIKRYNAAVKGVSDYDSSRNGRYTRDVSGGYGAEIDALITEYEQLKTLPYGDQLLSAFNNLKELQSNIRKGNEQMKFFGNAKSYYDSQAQDREYDAQRKEIESRRGTTRDSATVQSELDQVNGQLQDLYKQLKTKNILDALGAAASNVLASSSGFATPMPHNPQTTPEIIALEQRKKELEEEQTWAQYFIDEKNQQDSASWAQKYAGQTYDQLLKTMEYGGLNGTDEYKWLQEYAPTTMTADDKRKAIAENETEIAILEAVLTEYGTVAEQAANGMESATDRAEQIKIQYGSPVEIRRRIDALKKESWQYGNEIAYDNLDQQADFAEKSGYNSTEIDNWWKASVSQYNLGYEDLTYEYINGAENGMRDKIIHESIMQRNDTDKWKIYDHMKPEEIRDYNYLYATQGKEKAEEYLEYLTYTLNSRKMENVRQNAADASTGGFLKGAGASVASVPLNLVSGVGLLDAYFQNLGNTLQEAVTGEYAGPVDYNREAMEYGVKASTIRSTVSGNIAKATGTINLDPNQYPTVSRLLNGKSLGDVYQLGMSMADSAAIVALSPVLGGAGTVLLGGSAGTQGMLDAVANGATDEQALTMGVLNGAFEMIFEKVSLENLLQGGSKNLIHAILSQGAVEGSEEAFTSIANTVADIVVMAEKSGWEQGIAAYMAQGLSREEAEKQAFLDVAIQIGWDFTGGMISGGIMGGGDYGIEQYRSKKADSQAPVNQVTAQQQEETAQQPVVDIDPDSPQGQIIRNMTGEQTQQGTIDLERDSVQAQVERHMRGGESAVVGTVEQQEQLQRLSKITGREVVMYKGEAYENGYFDRSTGKIYVNVNGVDPVVQTFSHELTHSTEGAKVYNELKTWVFEKISQSGGNITKMKAEKIRLYESRGKQLDSVGAEQEIVADYIAKNLLTNEQIITEVCRSKPSLGRQILNWIDRFFAKLNITSKDRAALERAKILYAKALNQTQGSFNSQTAETAPVRSNNRETTADHTDDWKNLLDFREKIQNAFEAGEITEEEYEQYTEMADQMEEELQGLTGADVKQYSVSGGATKQDVVSGLKDILRRGGDINELRQYVSQVEQTAPKTKQNTPRADQNTREAERILRSAKQQGISVEEYLSQNWELYETETGWDPAARKALELEKGDNRQFSFSGRGSLTADESLLDTARQMHRDGADAEEIRQQTGWFVGKDGKWRFEIDDSQMELSDTIHNYIRLGELIQHEKLFAAYPDLAYIQVTFENKADGHYGAYNRQFDSISLSSKLTDPGMSEALKDALIHEIQHAIQNREGFTAGATVEGWNRKIQRGFDSRRTQDIRKAQETERKLAQIQQEQPEFYRDMMELEAMTPTVSRGAINWDTLEQIEEDPPQWQAFDARRDALQEQYGEMEVWDFMDLLHDRKRLAKTGRTAVELYYDTAGEIEARNTEQRRSYSEEQRKNTPPRQGGEDTVLAEGNNRQFSISNTYGDYDKTITVEDVNILHGIGRKSVNDFTSDDLRKAHKWAFKFFGEMKEKSPFFRAWFGEWRENSKDQVLTVIEDPSATLKNGRAKNNDTGVEMSWNAHDIIRETTVHAARDRISISAIKQLPDIVENAIFLDSSVSMPSSNTKMPNTAFMHSFYSVYKTNSAVYVIKLYAEMALNNKGDTVFSRAYQLKDIKKIAALGNGVLEGKPSLSGANTATIDTIADLVSVVKQYDPEYNPKPSSKVVNEDGTPMVVYHGTSDQFTEFKHSELSDKEGSFFFAQNIEDAQAYSSNGHMMAVYVNLQNPIDYNDMPSEIYKLHDKKAQVEALRKLGYDGWMCDMDTGWGEISAFNSNQIKSATDNIGTFDKDNPDIRYSISDTQAEAEDQQEVSDAATTREQLPKKAQNYLKRVERELLKNLAGMMNAHHFTDRSYLQDIIRDLSNEFLRTGTVSQETKDNLFAQAYTRGVVVDAEFYEQFKEVKTYLRTVSVTLSQKDTSNIADWFDFRKRAFGTLRIVNEGGLPVDTAYDQLREMAPALFPEGITHPADQLVHMYEVARSITKSEKTLREYHHADAQTFRKWAKADFESAICSVIRELRTVKRVSDEKAAKDAEEAKKVPVTPEEAMTAYTELKQARRNYEKVTAKNLLTDQDEMQVGRLLKGEILPKHLDKDTDNVEGILAVFEAKKEYERLCGVIAEYKRHRKGELRKLADSYLQNAGQWVDKRIGFLYSRETMRRNIQDLVKDQKEAAAINAEFFDPIQVAEAAATKFKTKYRDRVRALKLSTKVRRGDTVSEAHAVQLLGEVQDTIRTLENARGRIRQKNGKTLAEWRAVIDEMWQSSPSLDREKIEGAVREFRYIYDDLFRQMNEVRVRNGYEPVNYRKGYFPHFQPGGDGIIAQFGRALGISTEVQALPTTINGLTHTFKPGIQWFGNAQERLGFNTAYDAVEGFDKYIEGVASVIHQTDNIQKLRALASQVRYRTTEEGIRQRVDEVLAKDTLTEEEKQARINQIYEQGRFSLSNFVVELDEYTNLLANKKSKLDRTMEGLLGRRAYTVMKNIESRVGANMIAGNLSSALTNIIPLTQASAQLDRFSLLRGMWSALQSYRQDDGIVGKSTFLTNRRGSDPLVKNWAQKTSEILGMPMELIDNFVSDSIVRAAYFQNLKHGLSDAEAMHQADIFAAGVMADRSKGSMPTLFESRNPILKAFTQFQLEVNNQFSEVFKDLPRNHAEKGTAMLALVFLKYFLGAFIFDDVYEYFIGRRPALDPIDVLNSTVGDLTGYELPNLLELGEGLITGDMPSFETEKVGLGTAGINLVKSAAEELPFSSIVTDGGRIPVSSAIPDFKSLWNAATDTEMNGKKRWKEAQDELNKLAYIVPPFGGNQISKIWKGVKAYIDGGSYSVNNDGEDILQYPVYKDDPQDAFWSLVRATIMGKSALPEAQEWVEGGFDSLNAKQTAIYQDLLDAGVKDREAYDVIREMESVTKTDTSSKEAEQRQFLRNSDLMDDGKAILYYGMLASDKDQNLMDSVTDSGADPWIAANLLMDLQDAENTDKKRELIAKASLTQEEKAEIYREKVSDAHDADIAALRVAGIGFNEYLKIYQKSADTNSLEFSYWVDSQGYSDKQAEVIKNCFGDNSAYEKYVDKGLDPDAAYKLADELDDLEPMEGKTSVQQIQRWRLCVDFTDNTEDQMTALYAVMQPTQYQKVEMAYDFGVKPREYVSFKEILPNYDSDGNGYYKQAEITAAIDSLNCSVDVKAVLWQLAVGKSTKGKSNPYSRKIGQQVYEARQAAPKVPDEEEESTFADDFSAEIEKQWS